MVVRTQVCFQDFIIMRVKMGRKGGFFRNPVRIILVKFKIFSYHSLFSGSPPPKLLMLRDIFPSYSSRGKNIGVID